MKTQEKKTESIKDEHLECCGELMTIDGRIARCEICDCRHEINQNKTTNRK